MYRRFVLEGIWCHVNDGFKVRHQRLPQHLSLILLDLSLSLAASLSLSRRGARTGAF